MIKLSFPRELTTLYLVIGSIEQLGTLATIVLPVWWYHMRWGANCFFAILVIKS